MPQRDSIDKIVTTYFAAVTAEPFTYKDRLYLPRPLVVSHGIFQGFTCPAQCGGCCARFTLDYLPSEPRPYPLGSLRALRPRTIDFDGREVMVFSDLQRDHDDYYCRNLNKEDGRCGIHGRQPFTCDFELIRFAMYSSHDKPNRVTQRLFGRGAQMLRIDGNRGALCTITPANLERAQDATRRMLRLREWADHFGVVHRLDPVIEWMEKGPHSSPLTV